MKGLQHDIVFAHVRKRIGCFAHSIQLIIQKFRDDSMKLLMKKTLALVKRVNMSSRANEILLSLCGKKPVSNVPLDGAQSF